ncbi:hypothetical protein HDU97_004201 [Phlyctochytrium planicorne]|nr:hypothetical protein HDU97_004201 [Phlyctochytrium planicorne]
MGEHDYLFECTSPISPVSSVTDSDVDAGEMGKFIGQEENQHATKRRKLSSGQGLSDAKHDFGGDHSSMRGSKNLRRRKNELNYYRDYYSGELDVEEGGYWQISPIRPSQSSMNSERNALSKNHFKASTDNESTL